MTSLFPREEHAEALFHRILSNPGAEQQLYETFCMEQENASLSGRTFVTVNRRICLS